GRMSRPTATRGWRRRRRIATASGLLIASAPPRILIPRWRPRAPSGQGVEHGGGASTPPVWLDVIAWVASRCGLADRRGAMVVAQALRYTPQGGPRGLRQPSSRNFSPFVARKTWLRGDGSPHRLRAKYVQKGEPLRGRLVLGHPRFPRRHTAS